MYGCGGGGGEERDNAGRDGFDGIIVVRFAA
jgi:hypothetical protein